MKPVNAVRIIGYDGNRVSVGLYKNPKPTPPFQKYGHVFSFPFVLVLLLLLLLGFLPTNRVRVRARVRAR